MDVRHMAERFKLKPDPVRPFAILAGIADEDVRHARCLTCPMRTMIAAGEAERKLPGKEQRGAGLYARQAIRPSRC